MNFKDKFIHVTIIVFVELLAVYVLWFSLTRAHVSFPLPKIIRDAISPGFSGPKTPQLPKLTATKILPYPSEENISTFPNIEATFALPLSNSVDVTIDPKANFTVDFQENRTKVVITLNRPLKAQTTYTVTITDKKVAAAYTWSFTTNQVSIDQKVIGGIQRVKEQLPYTDPNQHFSIFYAPQTDLYFITIHDDERSEDDRNAALAWLRSQGVTNIDSLQIVWTPGDVF